MNVVLNFKVARLEMTKFEPGMSFGENLFAHMTD